MRSVCRIGENGVSNREEDGEAQVRHDTGWRQPIELGSPLRGCVTEAGSLLESGLWCFLPDSGTDRSVVDVSTDPTFVECDDLVSQSGQLLA